MFPLPVRHGMTIGELATMINEKGWLKNGIRAELTVVPMSGWRRSLWFDETGLPWRTPSPNMPDLHVAIVYPGTCLFEGTNVSEGRGTYEPFRRIGAPWLNIDTFGYINKVLDLPGVRFGPIRFIPHSIPAMSPRPKHMDQTVYGVNIVVSDRNLFRPYLTGIALVKYFHDADPGNFKWHEKHFDRLCGTDKIRKMIQDGKTLQEIQRFIEPAVPAFLAARKPFLLYHQDSALLAE